MNDNEKQSEGVRAVDRALDILLAFSAEDHSLTAGQLLKRVDLSRPTLYRLLRTLEQKGFVQSEGEPQKFRLGPAVGHLAHTWSSAIDLTALAHEGMRRVWEATGETVALFNRIGMDRVCVAEMPSRHPLSFKRGVGYRERIALGASGRVILAHMGEGAAQAAAEAGALPFDAQRLQAELAQIRERGYAMSRDELIQGAVAVAAPFFDGGGQVVGSLVVFGPAVRIEPERAAQYGALLVGEAAALSARLGYRPVPASGNVRAP